MGNHFKDNIPYPYQFIHLHVPKGLPSSEILRSVGCYRRSRRPIGPSLSDKQPKNNLAKFTGCPLKQYRRNLRRLYVMKVTLTLCGTSICIDETAETSYAHFHILGGYTLLALKNVNYLNFLRVSSLLMRYFWNRLHPNV